MDGASSLESAIGRGIGMYNSIIKGKMIFILCLNR